MILHNFKQMMSKLILEGKNLLQDPTFIKYKMDYNKTFMQIHDEKYAEFKKGLLNDYLNLLKKDLLNKIVLLKMDKTKYKIIEINDMSVELVNKNYEIHFIEDGEIKRKIPYKWDSPGLSDILILNDILELMRTEYAGNYMSFSGKPIKGGSYRKIATKINKIGYSVGKVSDFIVGESDEGEIFIIDILKPITTIDEKQYKSDPYGEENWDEWSK